jgi:RNA polymerase sigma factor (sigma-70 family)
MAQESSFAPLDAFCAQYARLIEWLHAEAKGARWGLARNRFAEALRRSAEKRYGGARAGAAEVEAYLKSLHLEDLALACACGEGLEAAWEFFVKHFRQELRAAARAILRTSGVGDETRAEELADSLYAELYGVSPTGSGRRKSLFEYFHGRENKWRPQPLTQRSDSQPADPDRERYLARLDAALSAAIVGLAARERMLLACYYVDQLTLAEIGRTLGEHESTVSRQLDRVRRDLREAVTQRLFRGAPARDGQGPEPGLDEAQVELVFEYALSDWPFDLSRALSEGEAAVDPPEK